MHAYTADANREAVQARIVEDDLRQAEEEKKQEQERWG